MSDAPRIAWPMMNRLVRIVPLVQGRVQIRTPCDRLTIGRQAQLACELLSLCNGTRRTEDVMTLLSERGYPEREIRVLFDLFTQAHILVAESGPAGEDIIFDHTRHLVHRSLRLPRLHGNTPAVRDVQVFGSGHLAAAVRVELLQLGIRSRAELNGAEKNPPLVIACSDYENGESFRDANRRAVEERSPILFACVAEMRLRIGPLVVPGETACYECFHQRLRAGLAFREEFDAYLAQNTTLDTAGTDSRAGLYARLGATLVASQIVSYLLGATQYCLLELVVDIDPLGLEVTKSRVLRLPRCEVCGRNGHSAPVIAIRDWL